MLFGVLLIAFVATALAAHTYSCGGSVAPCDTPSTTCGCKCDDSCWTDIPPTCCRDFESRGCVVDTAGFLAAGGMAVNAFCLHSNTCGSGFCVPSPDSPPPSPPPAAALLDPHFATGHGDTFDFKGEDNTIYNLVSHQNVSVNAFFQHADHVLTGAKKKLVHGSFMRAAYVTVKTNTSRMLHVEYSASRSSAVEMTIVGEHTKEMGPSQALAIDNVAISFVDRSLMVRTPEWQMQVTSKVVPGIVGAANCATGRCIVNVAANPLINTDSMKVAPHGLIGQSFDADDMAVVGKLDSYDSNETTTVAMGEGAIEGDSVDYKMQDKFSTAFAFSRFGLTAAAPRNASKLSGMKYARKTSGSIAAGSLD